MSSKAYRVFGVDGSLPSDILRACRACAGRGAHDCARCHGDGDAALTIDEAHDEAAEDGRPCPNGVRECPGCIESARDAGIPLAVIMGKRRLTDCELRAHDADDSYRRDMIDAGRGYLLRDC